MNVRISPACIMTGERKREHLFIEVMHEFFMERFWLAVLIQVDILPVQFLQYFGEYAIVFALLSVHLFRDFGKRLFGSAALLR